MLALKAEYKAATGADWKPPAAPSKAAPAKAAPAKASTPPKVIDAKTKARENQKQKYSKSTSC